MKSKFFKIVKYSALSFVIFAFLAAFTSVSAEYTEPHLEYSGQEQYTEPQEKYSEKEKLSEVELEALQQKIKKIQQLFLSGQDQVVMDAAGNITITLISLNFESGKSKILSKNYQLLDNVYKAAEMFPERKIKITGHTDSVGSALYNRILSRRRAKDVARYMEKNHGVNPDNLEVIGAGEKSPIASNYTTIGRRLNRRIEFTFLAQ